MRIVSWLSFLLSFGYIRTYFVSGMDSGAMIDPGQSPAVRLIDTAAAAAAEMPIAEPSSILHSRKQACDSGGKSNKR